MHEHHRERVKDRFIKECGLDSFEEHQALELLLFYAIPRKDTNETAHLLLEKFGNIHNLFSADVNDIAKVKGIGKHTAILIKLIPEMCRYYLSDQSKRKTKISNITDAKNIILPKLYGKANEHIYLFCLDGKYNLSHYELLNKGTFSNVDFSIRNIAEIAFRFNSEMVVLAHNHPSGMAYPSEADKETTQKIAQVLRSIDIKLVDHIIFAGNEYYSFSENRMLQMDFTKEQAANEDYTEIGLLNRE